MEYLSLYWLENQESCCCKVAFS